MTSGKITIGNVEVTSLSDAMVDNYPITLDELFPSVSDEDWEPYRERYPEVFGGRNVWRVEIFCFLLRSQGRTVLVDTGIGPAGAPYAAFLKMSGRLIDRLRIEGVRPEDVENVVLTHLHPDHAGWNVRDEAGERRLTFPRASYLVHEADWDTFHRPEVQAALPFPFVDQIVTPLEGLGGLELTSGDRAITEEVTAIHTPGHTPGHMSVLVVSGGERAIVWGDVMVHPAQVTEPDWNISFDHDGETASETRRRLTDRIEAEGMTVAACHFPEPGFGHIVRLEGRRYWQVSQD